MSVQATMAAMIASLMPTEQLIEQVEDSLKVLKAQLAIQGDISKVSDEIKSETMAHITLLALKFKVSDNMEEAFEFSKELDKKKPIISDDINN